MNTQQILNSRPIQNALLVANQMLNPNLFVRGGKRKYTIDSDTEENDEDDNDDPYDSDYVPSPKSKKSGRRGQVVEDSLSDYDEDAVRGKKRNKHYNKQHNMEINSENTSLSGFIVDDDATIEYYSDKDDENEEESIKSNHDDNNEEEENDEDEEDDEYETMDEDEEEEEEEGEEEGENKENDENKDDDNKDNNKKTTTRTRPVTRQMKQQDKEKEKEKEKSKVKDKAREKEKEKKEGKEKEQEKRICISKNATSSKYSHSNASPQIVQIFIVDSVVDDEYDEYEEVDSEDDRYENEHEDDAISTCSSSSSCSSSCTSSRYCSEQEGPRTRESANDCFSPRNKKGNMAKEMARQKGKVKAFPSMDSLASLGSAYRCSSDKGTDKDKKSRQDKAQDKDKGKKKSEIADSLETSEALLRQLRVLTDTVESKFLTECIRQCEENIVKTSRKQEKMLAKEKERNERIFHRLFKETSSTTTTSKYFETLDASHQKRLIKELRKTKQATTEENEDKEKDEDNETGEKGADKSKGKEKQKMTMPYVVKVLENESMSSHTKSIILSSLRQLNEMTPEMEEYHKLKAWIDAFMQIPLGVYKQFPVNLNDGVAVVEPFLENAKRILDEAVYGLEDAKMQIMQYIGQMIVNPSAVGSCIAIQGAPGTGKTSLVQEGVSKILGRPFSFISLGGATDGNELKGLNYYYQGAHCGQILNILMKSKCMNPIIYFDELDKVVENSKGENEIYNILVHLTDSSQNMRFSDNFFTGIEFDLSRCLFIFSYNDESKVSPILRDRLFQIRTNGYNLKEKKIISTNYLLPKIQRQINFQPNDIILSEQVLTYIITTFCGEEQGVRNLKRCLEMIHMKLNLYRLIQPNNKLFEPTMALTNVQFPYQVTIDSVNQLIKAAMLSKQNDVSRYMMYN